MAFSARHLCNNVDQNVSNISNDGEYDCSAGICTGEAPGIVDLPSRNAKSKKKKNAFSKNDLTELCHNVKAQGNKVSMAYLL